GIFRDFLVAILDRRAVVIRCIKLRSRHAAPDDFVHGRITADCLAAYKLRRLHAEMAMEDFGPRLDLFGRTFVDDMAVVDDVDALRERKRCREVLLDENDRLASVGKVAARLHEIADNDRREALERL